MYETHLVLMAEYSQPSNSDCVTLWDHGTKERGKETGAAGQGCSLSVVDSGRGGKLFMDVGMVSHNSESKSHSFSR